MGFGKGGRQLKEGSKKNGIGRRYKRSQKKRRSQLVPDCNSVSPPPDSSPPATPPQVRERPKLTESERGRRQVAIGYIHTIMGSPALSRSVVKDIAVRLNMNDQNGRKAVRRTLGKKRKLQEEIANGTGAHTSYDLSKRSPKEGPKK